MVPLQLTESKDQGPRDDGFKFTPQQLWAAFCRHWFLSITLGLLAAIPAAYLAWNFVPTPYKAETQIRILASRPKIGFDIPEDGVNFRILKAREIQRVKHPDTIKRALDEIAYALEGPGEDQNTRRFSALMTFRELPRGTDKAFWLRNKLSVQNTSEETFAISLEGEHPEELSLIVNAVSRAYFLELEEDTSEETTDRLEDIETEVGNLKRSIKGKQEEIKLLASAIEGSTITAQDLQRESDLAKMSELQREVRDVEKELVELRSQIDHLNLEEQRKQQLLGRETNGEPTRRESKLQEELSRAVQFDPKYLRSQSKIAQIRRTIKRWKDRFNNENLPEIKELKLQLSDAEQQHQQLYEALMKEYAEEYRQSLNQGSDFQSELLASRIRGLEVYKNGLIEELKQLKVKNEQKIEKIIDLELKREELEHYRKLMNSLINQKSTLGIEQQADDRIRKDIPAEVPEQRETKKRNMLTAGAGVGTFGFVIVLFTVIELTCMRVSSLRSLENECELPILGTIPRLPSKILQSQSSTRKAAIYKHTFTEAIDSSRTVLLNQIKKTPMKTIMVTSAVGGEGKSTLSSHLAISFARAGRRTLLIDGDLRRPRLHDVFGIQDFPGFCETLRGETPVDKCIYQSGVARLDIMPAGEVDAFTLGMLAEPETHDVFTKLRNSYDLVLFDSAPILPVADSLLIIQSIDGVLMSVRKDHSRMSKVAAALKKVQLVGGKIIGSIVIGIHESEYGYQSSYYEKSVHGETVTSGTA